MNEYLLEVKSLQKIYKNTFKLPIINFNLEKGEILTVLGSNGSGKTTLSNLIVGLTKPDSGEVIFGFSGDPYKSIGYAPEVAMLWPMLTPLEQIDIISSMYKLKDKNLALSLLKILSMDKYRSTQTSKLSSGNKKKLNFILSVLHKPRLLILDEPFNSLDPTITKILISWLINYIKGGERSVIITTNRPDIIDKFYFRVLDLDDVNHD
ncbi:MAG: ABC transporter ATP-binding protein [Spirochaetaceae bacterium]